SYRSNEENNGKTSGDVTGNISIEKEPRKPKRKVAVLVGFCGTGYQGMQINRNAKTIEEDLFKAFVAAGAISKDNSDDPKKVRAPKQSIKWFFHIPNLVEKINENLTDQIRVWGNNLYTIRSFHAKTLCDSRIYEYLLPTYVFIPRERDQIVSSIGQLLTDQNDQTQFIEAPLATAEEMIEKRKYRIPSKTLNLVRQGFKAYEETPLSLIHKTFGNTKINIPKAPALGLLLDQPVFRSYNKKAVDNDKELIEFDIYKVQNNVNITNKRDYGYLNHEGEIPECAIVNPKENFNKDADDENQEENDSD
ncbi:13596_t:CDS:2, partial [Racocetra fulgida]